MRFQPFLRFNAVTEAGVREAERISFQPFLRFNELRVEINPHAAAAVVSTLLEIQQYS